ncbi:MAG TPA: nuclear transport factor 2 family protein [Pyrinomonadaceae bacterium]|jgi:ketosteroid isomerase-like protein|nr:nuclear transport factor 2 family protein [Pyrinomonadaceae bacterium]
MKYLLFQVSLIVCLFVFSTNVFGQNSSKTAESVIKTLQDICKAYEKKETDVLLKYMTEDFTLTASDGTITTRDDEIKELKSGKVSYQIFENRDMKVRLHDKTAVVTGRTVVKGDYEKAAIDAEFQFTDTLIWKNGHWWIVASHASRIKKS